MSFPYHPRPSIYTDSSRYHYPATRRSGYLYRPLRPYRRKTPHHLWQSPAPLTQGSSPEGMVVPTNALPTWQHQPPIGSEPAKGPVLPLYIDSSMLSTWRSCRRKHFWSTLNSLYPTGKSVHLIAGGAIADAMHAARAHVFAQPDPTTVGHSEVLEAAYPAFSTSWGDYSPPDTPRQAKTFVNTWAALVNYLEQYPPGTDPVQPMRRADGTPAIEYRFAIPLPILHPITNDPILFVGRFDMVGMYGGMGASVPVVLDEKTTSAFTMQWADSWDLRGQFMGYIWALRAQNIRCAHAVVRGIAIQKTQYDTRSALVHYPDHLIDRWYQQLLVDVQHIVDAYTLLTEGHHNIWPPNTDPVDRLYPYDFADACNSYGGCAFAPLCSASNPTDFTSNYIHHVWNPLEPQPVKELPTT